ncbi:nucleoside phosphorylase domain-containing protein [Haematococcus lacustris]
MDLGPKQMRTLHARHRQMTARCCKRSSCGSRTNLVAFERIGACSALGNGVALQPSKPVFSDANFPMDGEGRTYHLGTKRGEVANRILSVGSTQRAQLLSQLLHPPAPGRPLFSHLSSRGFLTLTGRYQGVPVSIVSTHMGMPNMDFVVRESRAVVEGHMAIVRLGTCGAVQRLAKLGDLLVASSGSIAVRRNPDAWTQPLQHAHYCSSLPVPADPLLTSLLVEEAAKQVGSGRVVQGLNASADSFYSSQGRLGGDFQDANEQLLAQLCAAHHDLISLEMETFHLLDLARCSRGGSVKAVGMCIALAERYSNRLMSYAELEAAELAGGRAALAALARMPLAADPSTCPSLAAASGLACVWQ